MLLSLLEDTLDCGDLHGPVPIGENEVKPCRAVACDRLLMVWLFMYY